MKPLKDFVFEIEGAFFINDTHVKTRQVNLTKRQAQLIQNAEEMLEMLDYAWKRISSIDRYHPAIDQIKTLVNKIKE